jgi:hypothetical protein
MHAPARLAAAFAAALLLTHCSTRTASEDSEDTVAVAVSAVVVGTPIAIIVVEVDAADLAQPLFFNLTVSAGVATGTLRLPPGLGRTLTARGYDTAQEITHEGSVTIDVARGQNPPVSIPMVPRSGHVEVTIQIGPVSVVVEPTTAAIDAGATFPLAAVVRGPDGTVLDVPVEWATVNPAVATVDSAGLVTGVAAGTVQIVATVAGVAGAAVVDVGGGAGAIERFGYPVAFPDATFCFLPDQPLIAERLDVPVGATVTHLAAIFTSTGLATFGLYADAGGQAGALLVATAATAVVVGPNEIAVARTPIPPGAYWIAVTSDACAAIDVSLTTLATYELFSPPSPLATLPDPFPPTEPFVDGAMNFYAVAETGAPPQP